MSHFQHFIQIFCAFFQVSAHVPAVSPVIEPADPELRAHKRAALCVLFKHLKTFFCLGTEVSGGQHAGKPSAGKRLIHGTV